MAPHHTQLPVVVCPGFHNAKLTQSWVRSLPTFIEPIVLETSPISVQAVYQALTETFGEPSDGAEKLPVVAVGFSAGVVGLVGAIAQWQQRGGTCAQLIAIDGWGVPILGMPVTRISHDRFTHVTTLPLGAGETNFYATPNVSHLHLWEAPESVSGIAVSGWQLDSGVAMTAADYVRRSLRKQWNSAFNWRS